MPTTTMLDGGASDACDGSSCARPCPTGMCLGSCPNLIADALVLCLDAANPSSYPGSGTTWSDLSGRGYDFTLVNGPSFSPAVAGGIEQDGVDDYAERSYTDELAFNGNTSFSIQIFAKTKKLNRDYTAIASNGDSDRGGGWQINLFDDGNVYGGPNGKIEFGRYGTGGKIDAVGYNFTSRADAETLNLWTFSYSSTSGSNLYRNGVQVATSAATGGITRATSPNVYLGRRTLDATRVTSCIFYHFGIYTRDLSADEVKRNFDVLKVRTGL